jgi:hypothetical protein
MKYPSNFSEGKRLVSIKCGWCGNNTFAWEHTINKSLSNLDDESCCGTTCCFCGRDLQLWYKNWIYHAEFSDGCYITQWKNSDGKVGNSSGGPSHAPHLAFVHSDFPIIEWGTPDLSDKGLLYYGFKGSKPSEKLLEYEAKRKKQEKQHKKDKFLEKIGLKKNTEIIEPDCEHEWVDAGFYFCTVPEALFPQICKKCGWERIDSRVINKETTRKTVR